MKLKNISKIAFVGLMLTLGACNKSEQFGICDMPPPAGAALPQGKTCATQCRRQSSCMACCTNTGQGPRSQCREDCESMPLSSMTPDESTTALASINPVVRSAINYAGMNSQLVSFTNSLTRSEGALLTARMNCMTREEWTSAAQMLSIVMPYAQELNINYSALIGVGRTDQNTEYLYQIYTALGLSSLNTSALDRSTDTFGKMLLQASEILAKNKICKK